MRHRCARLTHGRPAPDRPQQEIAIRPPTVPRALGPLVVLALAVTLAGVGCSSAATPAAPASATPDLAPCPADAGTCVGPLTPGEHVSRSFVPTFSYDVPSGWRNDADLPGYFYLRPIGFDQGGIYLFRDLGIASQDPSCPRVAAEGLGRSARELVDWIAAAPGLEAGRPEAVRIGGLDGWTLEIALASDWTAACPFANGIPSHPLFVTGDGIYWAVAGDERLRLTIADLPTGGTVTVDVDAFFGADYAALAAAADPIVRSIEFR